MSTDYQRHKAFLVIKAVAKRAIEGAPFFSYSELAKEIGVIPPTGRGLGPILDEAARICVREKIPDVSSVVVSKDTLGTDSPMPSKDSFNSDGVWPITGVHMSDVPAVQKKVMTFDWKSKKTLKLD